MDKNYNDDETNSNTTNTAQLQVLYQARGRKIQELSEKLNEREEELGRQIRVLNHQMIMLKGSYIVDVLGEFVVRYLFYFILLLILFSFVY